MVGCVGGGGERGEQRDWLYTISPSACKSHSMLPQAGVMGDIKRVTDTENSEPHYPSSTDTRAYIQYVCT